MIIAYKLSIDSNESYMLGESTIQMKDPEKLKFYSWRFLLDGKLHPATCPNCGRKTNKSFINDEFDFKIKKYDISATYDGYYIVSEKFKSFCESQNIDGLIFTKLKKYPFYRLEAANILKFDADYAKTRFENYCNECQAYSTIIGTTPCKLISVDSPISKGLFRTDFEFGSSLNQHYLIIAGVETMKNMEQAKLEGLFFKEIDSCIENNTRTHDSLLKKICKSILSHPK